MINSEAETCLNDDKTNSIFKDIIPSEVDPSPSPPIFDKFIFDTVMIMLTSPRIFDKNHEILGCEIYIHYYPYYFLRVRGADRETGSPLVGPD